VGQRWPNAGLGQLSVAVHAWDLLKEVFIIFITSTTNALTSPPNCQGLKKKEKSDQQAQPREALGDKMICCQVASWMALVLEAENPRARGRRLGFRVGFWFKLSSW